MPAALKPATPRGVARSNRAPSAITYLHVYRFEIALRKAAKTTEPLTEDERRLIGMR